MRTLLLDAENWDLLVDAGNNIALASEPYSLAQDAASAVRTFQGECYYDITLGVPHWTAILGYLPPLSLVKAKLVAAALQVPGVVRAQVYISSFVNRKLSGQVQVTDNTGATTAAVF